MWSWSSKKDRGAKAESPNGGGSPVTRVVLDEKKQEWRVVLRDSAGAGVHVSWSDVGLETARCALEQQVREIQMGARRSPDVEVFLGAVVLIKIEKLPGERTAAPTPLETLPFNAQALTSLKVLRLAGEGLVSDLVLGQLLLQPTLREIDLPAQKLSSERLASLLGATCSSSPRLPALTALRLRKNALGSFPPEVLAHLPALTELDLSENALTAAPSGLFQLCPVLESLNIERNPKLTVRELDFRACTLRTLLMGQCALDWVPNLATISSLTGRNSENALVGLIVFCHGMVFEGK